MGVITLRTNHYKKRLASMGLYGLLPAAPRIQYLIKAQMTKWCLRLATTLTSVDQGQLEQHEENKGEDCP